MALQLQAAQVFFIVGQLAKRALRVDDLGAAHDVHRALEADEIVDAGQDGSACRDVRGADALLVGGDLDIRLIGDTDQIARLVVAEIDAAAAHAIALERDRAGRAYDAFALAVDRAAGRHLEAVTRDHPHVALHVEIGLIFADSRFLARGDERLPLAHRRDLDVEQSRAAVGI